MNADEKQLYEELEVDRNSLHAVSIGSSESASIGVHRRLNLPAQKLRAEFSIEQQLRVELFKTQ